MCLEVITATDPWHEFQFAVDLDVAGKYWMFWTPDDVEKSITFEVHFTELCSLFRNYRCNVEIGDPF